MIPSPLPKLRARQVLKDLRIESPDLLRYLKEICVERGAFVREHPLSDSEGRLVTRGDRAIITVSPSDTYLGRTRFSMAHELGHFELHRGVQDTWNCNAQNMNDWVARADRENRELEANEFAAELLMPLQLIRPELERQTPSLDALKDMASRYSVSLSAIACRFIELTWEACAVVFTRRGAISHAWTSRLFETQRYRVRSGQLDERAAAAQSTQGRRAGAPRTVSASVWLELPTDLAQEPLLEQSEHFARIDFGITLLWIQGGRLIRF